MTSKLDKYYDKITADMDKLQECMEANLHLVDPETVIALVEKAKVKWNFLNDEDKDYVHACEMAINERITWNLNED
jgi:hypothetical protein